MTGRSKAVVMVSGGLDSATVLALTKADNIDCYALSFDYGQRHRIELDAATRIAAALGAIEHRVMRIDFAGIGGSALTDTSLAVPEEPVKGIPVTYVPARNTVFLSLALAWAEVLGAERIAIGVNAVDYSGYPDCRPEYVAAFEYMAALATRQGVEGSPVRITAPLVKLSKADIIQRGTELGVDYAMTISCYQPSAEGHACGRCDACRLRRDGFVAAGIADPTRYVE
ncbi:MAG: 7-cyano-7-deazaguanine synthase QueC [Pseudomonadota bacterium]